jgi:hypothetical protein
MTMQEFKAWFDGFTEAFSGKVPTAKQWSRVKERVAEIDGTAITYPVYIDRYFPRYPTYPNWTYTTTTPMITTGFCSTVAMNELGRAESTDD